MKKRIVVHIGTHKTGTTSIQRALYEQRADLSAAGILYPRTDRDRGDRLSLRKHGEMSAVARRGRPQAVERERTALIEEFEASGATTMIVSEEGLSGPNPNCAEFFKPLAETYALEVVCYLRRQDIFVESFFNQVVKRAERELSQDIIEYTNSERTRSRLDYHGILCWWRDLPAKVTALDFAAEVKRGSLMDSFTRAANIEAVRLVDTQANTSPDMRVILAMMAMNKAGLDYNEKAVLRAGQRLAEKGALKPLKLLLGQRARAALLADCADSNARLAADFGVQFDSRLPEEDEAPVLGPDLDYLLNLLGSATLGGKQGADGQAGGADDGFRKRA